MKAITPVIAVILLLLITISLVGFAFVFLGRTTETAAESGEQQLEQQLQQFGTSFLIESVDKNQVYIRNTGTTTLTSLAFFVDSVLVTYSGPSSLATNAVGTYFLNDSQLAMLPDPARLRATAAGASDEIEADFYGNYDVGYWKFDEGSGTIAGDSSGNSNSGTLNGAWTAGQYGNALDFDATAWKYVAAGPVVVHNVLSLQAWVRPRSYPSERSTIILGTSAYYLSLASDGSLQSYWYGTSNQGYHSSGPNAVSLNAWSHVASVWDGSNVRLYVNGILRNTIPVTGSGNSATALNIGAESLSRQFVGTIDEVRILNVARTMSTA